MGSALFRPKYKYNVTIQTLDNLEQPTKEINDDRCPDPQPPRRCKADILPDVSVLKHIDEHVLKTPKFVEGSVESLCKYLINPATSELETVRAFYKWITENIRYDTGFLFGETIQVPSTDQATCESNKNSVCDYYASVFQLLCKLGGIHVMKVNGYSMGYSNNLRSRFTEDILTNHTWNVVCIDGEWRFIDTMWGAGYWGVYRTFEKEFNDFYFLTDPELFIIDHFPFFDNDINPSSKWQLLKKPISLDMFSKTIKPSRHASEWGINFSSHPFTLITIERTVNITLLTKSCLLSEACVKLYNSSGVSKDEYAFIIKHSKSESFTVNVCPPATGEYCLDIYGCTVEATPMRCLITYRLHCNKVANVVYPLPCFNSYYGPVTRCNEVGFEDVDKIPTSITSHTGVVFLHFKVKDGINVMAELENYKGYKLGKRCILLNMDEQLELTTSLAGKGYYRLVIYSRFKSNSYTTAINILIKNMKQVWVPWYFPETFQETIEFKCSIQEPLSRRLPAGDEVRFRFKSPVLSEAYVMQEHIPKKNKNSWDHTITTNSRVVHVFGKRAGDEKTYVLYKFYVE